MEGPKYRLKLFVTGKTHGSARVIANVRRICTETLGAQCDLIVIDVLDQPLLAARNKILATPTLVRESPPPVRRIIGDFTEDANVRGALTYGFSPEAGGFGSPPGPLGGPGQERRGM